MRRVSAGSKDAAAAHPAGKHTASMASLGSVLPSFWVRRDAQPLHCLGVPEIRAGAQPGLFFQRQGADKLFDVHGGSPFIVWVVSHIITRRMCKNK
jgi:hypothetical protein